MVNTTTLYDPPLAETTENHEYKGAEDTEEPQYRGPTISHMQIFYSTDQSLYSHAVQGSTVITLKASLVLNKVTY